MLPKTLRCSIHLPIPPHSLFHLRHHHLTSGTLLISSRFPYRTCVLPGSLHKQPSAYTLLVSQSIPRLQIADSARTLDSCGLDKVVRNRSSAMNLSGQNIVPQLDEPSKAASAAQSAVSNDPNAAKKRKNHRAGKKKRNRKKSFGQRDDGPVMDGSRSQHSLLDNVNGSNGRPPMYRLGQSGANLSDVSLDSQALLDHRYFTMLSTWHWRC